jgi:hypothetical protein
MLGKIVQHRFAAAGFSILCLLGAALGNGFLTSFLQKQSANELIIV